MNDAAPVLRDRCGRRVDYLRVSVTDRCNLRCTYCMPAEGLPLRPRDELLTYEDITFTVRVANALGIDRIRITGGEPLLRRDLAELVRMLREETTTRELALTTNALLLHKHAHALREAGLDRLNVSLDSLDPDRFERLTRSRLLEETWRGIDAASDAGFDPIKVNTVVLAGFNDDELERWVELTQTRPLIVRFLELMPIGEGAALRAHGGYFDLSAARRALEASAGLQPVIAPHGNGPARYWQAPGARGMVGFITPLSHPYCDTCSRFRLTSTGEVRPCLAHDVHVPLRDAIRARDASAVREGLLRAAAIKPVGHHWQDGATTRTGMSELGG